MTKAFLFDMDGVLANTESEWDKLGYDQLLIDHFGKELASQVFVSSGLSIKGIFDEFVKKGWQGSYADFYKANEVMGDRIYSQVELTPGITQLIDYLHQKQYLIGVVSSSPEKWVIELTDRITNYHYFDLRLSVNNHKTLNPKPAPDPYLYAIDKLGVTPQDTIILEDSVTGVTSGKAAGAKVICFTRYVDPINNKWQQIAQNADYYAKSMEEVKDIVAKIGSG